MMRVAGRDVKGFAKGIKTTGYGELLTNSKREKNQIIGDFDEPYDEGYVGNIMVSGLEVFDKIGVSSNIQDAKLGTTGTFVAFTNRVVKYVEGYNSDEVWTYTGWLGNRIDMIRLDYQDNVIIVGSRNNNERLIEKIDGLTGLLLWRNHDIKRAGVEANDAVVDSVGDVYVSGRLDPNDPLKGEVVKYSSVTGVIIWKYVHTVTVQTLKWHLAIDKDNYVYLSYSTAVVKLNQTLANTTTPPVVVWNYPRVRTDAFTTNLFINVDLDGFIYRIEHTYAWNFGAPIRTVLLVKIDQNGGSPLIVWERVLIANSLIDITNVNDRIYLDEDGIIYHNRMGKSHDSNTDYWGGTPPITITDVRDGFVLGFKKILGYNNDTRYEVYKTGKDLKENYLKGVK